MKNNQTSLSKIQIDSVILLYSNGKIEEAIKAIIENPDGCDLPEEVGDQYALISYLAHKANDTRVRKAAGVLLGRFSPELSVLLARDMLRANAKFAVDPAYLAFAAKHQDFLQ